MFSKKLQKNIDRLIRDLYLKPKIYQAFKKNPEEVGLRYGVSKEAIEAIKTDNWKELLEMGMNPKLLEDPVYRITDKIRLRFLRFAVSALVIVFGMLVSFLTFPVRTRAKRVAIELPKRARLELLPRVGIRARLARRAARKIGALARVYQRLEKRKANIFAQMTRMKRKESVLNRRPFDHIGNFNFKVEIDGVSQGAFKNIKFLDPIEEYKDGDDISIVFGKGNDVNVEGIEIAVEKIERSAKAAKNEQFRHNIVMSLIQKMPDGRF